MYKSIQKYHVYKFDIWAITFCTTNSCSSDEKGITRRENWSLTWQLEINTSASIARGNRIASIFIKCLLIVVWSWWRWKVKYLPLSYHYNLQQLYAFWVLWLQITYYIMTALLISDEHIHHILSDRWLQLLSFTRCSEDQQNTLHICTIHAAAPTSCNYYCTLSMYLHLRNCVLMWKTSYAYQCEG